jgi:hypothetical protein
MPAIDTIASFQTTVNSTLAAGVMATGDPSAIRNFPDSASCQLIQAFYDDVTTALPWRVRSPLLHDNVRGIQLYPGASAPEMQLPVQVRQGFQAQDTLTFELSTAASTGKALAALGLYYSQLPGVMSRLYSLGDIQGNVDSIKPVSVAIGSGANTAGIWLDTVVTTTEDLLHANTDYAVLGITFDQAVAAIGVKGADTGNLRVCAPGNVGSKYGSEYFVMLSQATGLPTIPVFNSANKGNTYVSLVSSAATGAAGTIQLILAEMAHNLA